MDDRDRAGTLKGPQDWTFVATNVLENNTIVAENISIITKNKVEYHGLCILYVLFMESSTIVLLFSCILSAHLCVPSAWRVPTEAPWGTPESSPKSAKDNNFLIFSNV